ncbi:MAG: glycosyltransferase family 9 protein [Chitinophagales bacterium]
MKILIIRFSSIGDIVLTSPVIRCIKKQIPSAEIHYLTKSSYNQIIQHNPYITVKHLLHDDLNETLTALKKENFDFIIDLHHNFRSWKIRMVLGKPSKAFNKINLEKWLYVNLRFNMMPLAHIVERYLETVKAMGVNNDGEGLDYFISPADEIRIEQLPLTHLHGFIAIAIGAQHVTKKLPVEKLKRLIPMLSYPIILLGGKEDAEAGEAVRAMDPLKVFNSCGKFTINQSASIIRLSKAVITNDTGMMHIAAAYKKKIISLWGNTVPQFGMSPYFGSKSISGADQNGISEIVEVQNLPCRPCSKLGYQKCPLGHFKCMNNIDDKKIIRSINSY